MKKYLLLFALLSLFCSFLQNNGSNVSFLPEYKPVTLVFVGDIMGHIPQIQAAYNPQTKEYNYDRCFRYVRKYIEPADLAIANLEVPVAGRPYSGYPGFSSPDALLDGLKKAGFDILLTANNHVIDRGSAGLERTIRQIENRGMLHAGSYIDKSQRDSIYPLCIDVKGIKIAFLNYTYGTNADFIPRHNIVNYIDSQQIAIDLRKAESLGADIKIAVMHWGTEYELQSNEIQQKLAHFLVKQGVNLVVGAHPHVVQNAELFYYKDSVAVPVFYSLGNFLSNQRKPNTNGGILLRIDINPVTKALNTASYLPVYVYRGVLDGVYQYHLLPFTDFIQNPSGFDIGRSDSVLLTEFGRETQSRLSNIKLIDNSALK
jgi:poly-gamma-glutamate synthesis protein (capsule biosynthesis protein)